MQIEDFSSNPKIASLTELMFQVEHARTPFETLCTVQRGIQNTYGPRAIMQLSTRGLQPGQFRLIELHLPGSNQESRQDPWKSQDFPLYEGGIIGQIIQYTCPILVHDVDWSDDPFFSKSLAGYRTMMAVPVRGHSLPITWAIIFDKDSQRFTVADLEDSVLRMTLIGPLLGSRALSEELVKAHELVDREVQRIGQIQRSLLPNPLPQVPGLEIATSYETAGRAGGDLYDFIPLGCDPVAPDRWGILIADASGHGPSAAIVIAITQALLHAHPSGVASPSELFRHLNQQLCRRPLDASFVTAFLGVYETSTRRLTYALAGHPPPLIRQPHGTSIGQLNAVLSLPLGIDASESFDEATVDFLPGTDLLLYTDGITEARNIRGEFIDESVIAQAFCVIPNTPMAVIEAVRHAVKLHEQGQAPIDDQTLVAIHFT